MSTESVETTSPPADAGRIQRLPTLLINQIAAGEVVDRPASVVKELIDNAIDAGGSRIVIELERGGIELIRVTDNGKGIHPGDLHLALAPHATSKIRAADDLDRIATMGFRGEALASIASVGRLSIRSRTSSDPGATEIDAEGDIVSAPRPASGPVGTSVTLRNLFFNTPARRKFLKTPATEQGHCVDIAEELALSHPAISFLLTCDGKRVLDLPPDQTPGQRVLSVLGQELAQELVNAGADEFDDARGVALWGLVGLPSLAKATAKSQHVFLNGRPIRDKTIQHALREAYRGLIEPGRYPTAVIMLEMDPGAVDVNVHPAKTEVRFRDSSLVHGVVLRAVRDALRAADLTPGMPRSRPETGSPAGDSFRPASGAGAAPASSSGHSFPPQRAVDPTGFVEFFKRPVQGPATEPLSYHAIRSVVEGDGPSPFNPALPDAGRGDDMRLPVGPDGRSESPDARDAALPVAPPRSGTPPQDGLPVPRAAERILQIHNSYVVTQDDQGMLIIDQHALHERVMFEQLLARVRGGDLESQRMLVPTVVPAPARLIDRLREISGLCTRIGVHLEQIGPAAVGVQAFPTFLFERRVEPGEFIAELIERFDDEGFAPNDEETLHEVLDMMACKAAIKAGDHMSEPELRDLLRMREQVERSSNCPHGRPTSIRLTIRELEKRFGRA